ncbi:MAG: hypothetical protein H6765_10845 [Candidatus Peribacteria bacterium]|nr:MAG: hypothetical protein H6765_10845 [Candidatus Peribacteria bacterium]
MLSLYFHNTNSLVEKKRIELNPLRTMQVFLQRKELKPWLISFMCMGIGGFIINSVQSLYMANNFGTPGQRYGYYLAGVGVLMAINMAVLIPRFWTKVMSTKALLVWSYSWLIGGLFLVSFLHTEVSYIAVYYVVMIL